MSIEVECNLSPALVLIDDGLIYFDVSKYAVQLCNKIYTNRLVNSLIDCITGTSLVTYQDSWILTQLRTNIEYR